MEISSAPRKLPDWIDGFLKYVDRREPPLMYKRAVAVSTIAACLRRKCHIKWGYLEFYPNLYIVLVGPPGSKKGTAMAPCHDFLLRLGVPLSAQAITKEALIKFIKDSMEMESVPDGPPIQHSSITVWSEEFTVFTGYRDPIHIQWACDWFDCRSPWTYRTKNMGTDKVIGICVNLIGATTPEVFVDAMPKGAIGGGFSSRVLFVVEEGREKLDVFPFHTKEEIELDKVLLEDLQAINMMRGEFKPDPASFLDVWGEWYPSSERNFKNPNLDHRYFQGYLTRRAAHALKLSTIMSASRTGDMLVLGSDLLRAINFLEATEANAHKVFVGFGRSEMAEVTAKVMQLVEEKGKTTLSELMRVFYNDADRKELFNVISSLETMGFCRMARGTSSFEIVHLKGEGK